MSQVSVVVATDRIDLLPELRREFGGEGVLIQIDRRQHERRQRADHGPAIPERRREARRALDVSGELDEFGFAVVGVRSS